MAIEILTPPGRIVWGHPLQKQIKTDPKTRKPILDKAGQQQDVWSFGLAIPVAHFAALEAAIAQAAYQQFPQGNFPRDFAWKIKRDNMLDENNKPYGEREGYAGHVVVNVSTQAFCPPAYKFENGAYRQLAENEIKCGDWVVAKLLINSHPGGVYVNPSAIELVGYDKEIERRSATYPNEAFGGRTYQLPPGVSATPVATAHGVGMPQGGQPAPMAYGQPAPVANYAIPGQPAPVAYNAAPQPVAHVQPQPTAYVQPVGAMPPAAHDFVNNAVNPGQPAPMAYGHPAPVAYNAVQPGGMPGVIPAGR